MDLQAFIMKQRALLLRFEELWARGNIRDSENFPAEMNEADWIEQLEIFLVGGIP
jgi:hypothetical protein